MRIAFLQRLWHDHLGVMSLAAVLKPRGHEAAVFIERGERDAAAAALAWRPDLIAFSSTTGDHRWALDTAARLKGHVATPIIMGGPHPTFFPEVVEDPGLDLICRGEGEGALAELLDLLAAGAETAAVRNLWVKREGRIVRNPVRPPIASLDEIPPPDRSMYFKYRALRDNPTKHFIAGRGCPHDCSFCYNHAIRELYRDQGPFVRRPSPGRMLDEIAGVKERYGLRTVVFEDDCFTGDLPWLREFLAGYRARIGLPFICNVRADAVTDEIAGALRAAGCFRVCFGVETGSERLRTQVLNKRLTDAAIFETVRLLRKHGIPFLANSMVGIPGETLEDALETVRFNARIRTDYPWCSILQPYPRTRIAEEARRLGLLHDDDTGRFEETFFKTTPLDLPHRREVVAIQRLFLVGVKLPWTIPALRHLARLPLRPLYDLVFLATFGYRYMQANRLRLRDIVSFGFRNLALFNKLTLRDGRRETPR